MAGKELAVQNGKLGEMANVTEIANALATVILDKNLSMDMRGKRYVFVEGWQLAGAYFGIVPIIKSLERERTFDPRFQEGHAPDTKDVEIKYRAEVELLDTKNNRIVGFGIAICSNKEKGKTAFDEFAVASMAQTRAVGKAYRLTLGWVIKLAGYEGTPAEEMDEETSIPKTEATPEDKAEAYRQAQEKMKGARP